MWVFVCAAVITLAPHGRVDVSVTLRESLLEIPRKIYSKLKLKTLAPEDFMSNLYCGIHKCAGDIDEVHRQYLWNVFDDLQPCPTDNDYSERIVEHWDVGRVRICTPLGLPNPTPVQPPVTPVPSEPSRLPYPLDSIFCGKTNCDKERENVNCSVLGLNLTSCPQNFNGRDYTQLTLWYDAPLCATRICIPQ